MPNWCFTQYAITGDTNELQALNETLSDLWNAKKPLVENGFGKNWLGCLVKALGGNPNKIWCRGDFRDNKIEPGPEGCPVLRFTTETAWGRSVEVEDFLSQWYPSLSIWFFEEEGGNGIYQTNDSDALYFKKQILLTIGEEDDEYCTREEVIEKLSAFAGTTFGTWKEAMDYVDKYNGKLLDSDEDESGWYGNWIRVLEPDYVD